MRPLGRGGVTRPSLGRIPRDTYVQICTPPYTYKHVGTRMYTYVHERTHMYSYVRARTRTYSYVHARTRTYTYVRVPWDSPQLGTPPTRGSEFCFFLLAAWLVELAGLDGSAGWPSLSGNAPTVRSISKIITLIILHSCQKMNNITIILIISLILILAVLQ